MHERKKQSLQFMTTGHAARTIGVNPRTLNRMVLRGQIDLAAKTTAGHPLFDPEEVERVRVDRIKNPPHMGRPSREMLEARKRERRTKRKR